MATSPRVAYCLSHPIQYQSPLILYLYGHGLDLNVYYASGASAGSFYDPEFGRSITWDTDLLGGYESYFLDRFDQDSSRLGNDLVEHTSYDHYLRALLTLWGRERPEAAWIHGWSGDFSRAAFEAARRLGIPSLLRAETFRECVKGGPARRLLHRLYYSRKFKTIDAVLAIGSRNRDLYLDYGVPEEKIFSTPYAVDNDFFSEHEAACRSARLEHRKSLGIGEEQCVFLFVGKLIPEKAASSLIEAAEGLSTEERRSIALLFVGEGSCAEELKQKAAAVPDLTAIFTGFKNQSELPPLYSASDVFVLPSLFEPWGLVVNEAMAMGLPLILSDRIGASSDLLRNGENGLQFEAGDAEELSSAMRKFLNDSSWRNAAGKRSREIIAGHHFERVHQGLNRALESVT